MAFEIKHPCESAPKGIGVFARREDGEDNGYWQIRVRSNIDFDGEFYNTSDGQVAKVNHKYHPNYDAASLECPFCAVDFVKHLGISNEL